MAFLKALTPEAERSLGASRLYIPQFPYRVGRESRVNDIRFVGKSRRQPDSSPNNDLYLADTGERLNISREHFQIEQRDGRFFLVDRGSVCGTLVEGESVGRDRNGGERRIEDGDVIIVGTSESKFVFKFLTA